MSDEAPTPSPAATFVVMHYGLLRMMQRGDEHLLMRRIAEATKDANRDLTRGVVILDSAGGSADAAYKIGRVLQACFRELDVVVPFYAKSAATLVCLSADRIVMGDAAELGPLDVQIEHPATEASQVSALDVVGALTQILSTGLEVANQAALFMRYGPRVSRRDALEIGFRYAAELLKPFMQQMDPITIAQNDRSLKAAKEYGVRLLRQRMFAKKPGEAEDVLNKLVLEYPVHSFAVDVQEAHGLGLKVLQVEQYEYCKPALDLFAATPSPAPEELVCLAVGADALQADQNPPREEEESGELQAENE